MANFSLKEANRKHHVVNTKWPKEKKLQIVAQWLAIGNLRLVSEVSGVSYGLLRQWRMEPWWNEFEGEIRRTEGIQLDNKITKIVNKALEAVEDRLDNGEIVLNNKTGELVRKPVQLRDVHKVAADMVSRREQLRENARAAPEIQAIPVQDQLKALAMEFARMMNGKSNEVIEVETVEIVREDIDNIMDEIQNGDDEYALHEEWEARLQEADGVSESPGPGGETGGEQPSPEDDDRPR
jgi:hypothetical protein